MSGIFEIRDKHGGTLHRLFCLLDSAAQAQGLQDPALVMLMVASRPVRTAMPH